MRTIDKKEVQQSFLANDLNLMRLTQGQMQGALYAVQSTAGMMQHELGGMSNILALSLREQRDMNNLLLQIYNLLQNAPAGYSNYSSVVQTSIIEREYIIEKEPLDKGNPIVVNGCFVFGASTPEPTIPDQYTFDGNYNPSARYGGDAQDYAFISDSRFVNRAADTVNLAMPGLGTAAKLGVYGFDLIGADHYKRNRQYYEDTMVWYDEDPSNYYKYLTIESTSNIHQTAKRLADLTGKEDFIADMLSDDGFFGSNGKYMLSRLFTEEEYAQLVSELLNGGIQFEDYVIADDEWVRSYLEHMMPGQSYIEPLLEHAIQTGKSPDVLDFFLTARYGDRAALDLTDVRRYSAYAEKGLRIDDYHSLQSEQYPIVQRRLVAESLEENKDLFSQQEPAYPLAVYGSLMATPAWADYRKRQEHEADQPMYPPDFSAAPIGPQPLDFHLLAPAQSMFQLPQVTSPDHGAPAEANCPNMYSIDQPLDLGGALVAPFSISISQEQVESLLDSMVLHVDDIHITVDPPVVNVDIAEVRETADVDEIIARITAAFAGQALASTLMKGVVN